MLCRSLQNLLPFEKLFFCDLENTETQLIMNAARNILAAGMRALMFGAVAPAGEAMVALQRRPVDADELTDRHPPTSQQNRICIKARISGR